MNEQYMSWFRRKHKGIQTPTKEKKDVPDGLWHRCEACKAVILAREHQRNAYTCPNCKYHDSIGSHDYFELLFDEGQYQELFTSLEADDPLHFEDSKPYPTRIRQAQEKTGLADALSSASGRSNGQALLVAAMDFRFIGGSMGSVVGEKLARTIDQARQTQTPLLVVSKSGGARMMESGFSLMQMAKTAAKLQELDEAKIPYISLMTDPTTGGVSASFAMLGDFNIAEPGALIGFAGPRVIRETIGKDLPEGFQRAEFLLEKGFLDFIVPRTELKQKINDLLDMLRQNH